ncbi:MAG: Ig domain-containing protein, partial [Solobacterium sp.]|nr:Ig domain-containing protein [Solobacterium sp.]
MTAVKTGTTTITVTTEDGNKTATCIVTVITSVQSVSLNETEKTLERGETFKLTATVTPENADETGVTWRSSDESIATVDDEGNVTAVSSGEATITVTTVSGGKTAECKVKVITPVSGVMINKSKTTIEAGKTETLRAIITPSTADNQKV